MTPKDSIGRSITPSLSPPRDIAARSRLTPPFPRVGVAGPVFQKEPAGDRTVCYCFAIGEADLRREIAKTAHSTAAQRITEHVQAGRCACEIKNPQGSCCLGNVATTVQTLLADALRETGTGSPQSD